MKYYKISLASARHRPEAAIYKSSDDYCFRLVNILVGRPSYPWLSMHRNLNNSGYELQELTEEEAFLELV